MRLVLLLWLVRRLLLVWLPLILILLLLRWARVIFARLPLELFHVDVLHRDIILVQILREVIRVAHDVLLGRLILPLRLLLRRLLVMFRWRERRTGLLRLVRARWG